MKLISISLSAAFVLALAIQHRSVPTADAATSCTRLAGEQTTLIIDGELYALIGSRTRPAGYIGGSSGQPVYTVGPLLRLARAFGLKGTPPQLLHLRPLTGAEYGEGGLTAHFDLHCRSSYRVIALVRRPGPIRFWLQEQRGLHQTVVRAFCMRAQLLPKGALLSATFSAPLSAVPVTFSIDRNGDGKTDYRGSFRRGGATFRQVSSGRC